MHKTLLALLPALAFPAWALNGIHFDHNDWQTVCDNTGTCRIAGYQSEDDDKPVSILLTRAAGANAPVSGRVYAETAQPLTLRINGKSYGSVRLNDDTGDLNPAQIQALLDAAPRAAAIELVSGSLKLRVSDSGMAAALLKADDFQKRIGTPSALIRKGSSNHAVLPPQPAPVIRTAAVSQAKGSEYAPDSATVRQTAAAWGKLSELAECTQAAERGWTKFPLDAAHHLWEVPCQLYAYQAGNVYVLTDHTDRRVLQIIPDVISNGGYENGVIVSSYKHRGIGDCWGSQSWMFDGKRFVFAEENDTGMCRGVAGGMWHLPTRVSDIRR